MLGPKRQHLEVRARQGKEQRGSGIGQTGRWGTTSAMDGAAQRMHMSHVHAHVHAHVHMCMCMCMLHVPPTAHRSVGATTRSRWLFESGQGWHRRRRVTEPMDRRSRIPLRKRQGTAAGQSDRQLPCRLAEARLWTSHKRSVSSPAGQGKTVLGATRSECWGHAESAARARAKAPHLGEHETMIKPQLRRINRDELVQPK